MPTRTLKRLPRFVARPASGAYISIMPSWCVRARRASGSGRMCCSCRTATESCHGRLPHRHRRRRFYSGKTCGHPPLPTAEKAAQQGSSCRMRGFKPCRGSYQWADTKCAEFASFVVFSVAEASTRCCIVESAVVNNLTTCWFWTIRARSTLLSFD